MRRIAAIVVLVLASRLPAMAQVHVSPTGVNVNGQGATTAFLTFGPLDGYQPLESFWCGEVIPAAPDIGTRCDPATLFGSLPVRYDHSQLGSNGSFTDIMSIPESVARRAYQAAVAGHSAEFFYVRHFVKAGFPAQFVAVTCRLTAGGARVPLSLVDVQLGFGADTPVLQVKPGDRVPGVSADIVYTGSGRLQGRWEIVLPGQELPAEADLLTEATLPPDRRATERRYAEIDRFDVFLGPTGRYRLAGPDPGRLPTGIEGQYLILLRIEATDDKEADSDLTAIGVGSGVVHAGGVAGFPMPVLRYVVGGGGSGLSVSTGAMDVRPADGITIRSGDPLVIRWTAMPAARYYRIEIESEGRAVHQAFMSADAVAYTVPPFVFDKAAAALSWRIVAVDEAGRDAVSSAWRQVKVEKPAARH